MTRVGRLQIGPGDRVHRDEVHLHRDSAQKLDHPVRVLDRVVHALDQRVLDGDSPALRHRIASQCVGQLAEPVFSVHGHDLASVLVTHGVKRNGELHLPVEFLAEAIDLLDETAGRHGDTPLGEIDAVGMGQENQRASDCVVVV